MGDSVTILPETDDYTLCVYLQGDLLIEDHESRMTQELRSRFKKNGFLNFVICYADDHKFVDAETADANMRGLIELCGHTMRMAYVNPSERKIFQIKLMEKMFGGEVRFFSKHEKNEAIAWAKQGRPS